MKAAAPNPEQVLRPAGRVGAGARSGPSRDFSLLSVPARHVRAWVRRSARPAAHAVVGTGSENRTLNVNVPEGVDTGTRIRLSGEGEAGLRGGSAGDLYIFIDVEPHELFEREGTALLLTMPVPMTTATLGGTIDVPSLMARWHGSRLSRHAIRTPVAA